MGLFSYIRNTSEEERSFHELRIAYTPGMTAISESVLHDMSVLDSKSAALLTFISVVLAALIFALGMIDGELPYAPVLRGILYAFMISFAVAAWIDLRCLYTMGRQSFPSNVTSVDYEASIINEIALRKRRYRMSLFLVEAGVVALLAFMIFWYLLSEHVIQFVN